MWSDSEWCVLSPSAVVWGTTFLRVTMILDLGFLMKNAGLTLSIALKASLGRTGTVT